MRTYERRSYNLFPKFSRGQRTGAKKRDLRWAQKIMLVVVFGLAVAMGLFTAEQVYRIGQQGVPFRSRRTKQTWRRLHASMACDSRKTDPYR